LACGASPSEAVEGGKDAALDLLHASEGERASEGRFYDPGLADGMFRRRS
jgi:hypothetical protein